VAASLATGRLAVDAAPEPDCNGPGAGVHEAGRVPPGAAARRAERGFLAW